jgi:RNA polymerase sigma factor for flagellar operon FliA
LEQRLLRTATDIEMAAEMGLSLEAYHDVLTATQQIRDESIDDAYSDHLLDFADDTEQADDAMIREQLAEALKHAVGRLNEREQTILQLYFVEELNLDEIGLILGVGAARVCQIKKAALTKARAFMDADAFV